MELNLTKIIVKKFKSSFQKNGFDQIVPEIKISDRPELSEFQCNDALKLAKLVSKSPRLVAENILSKLDKKIFSNISIDGPGFINMTVNPEVVSELAKNIVNDTMLGFVQQKKEKIVIDYAGMNIAKVMHIGHLRSNIVGQAIYNLGKFVGKEMIGDAHIGDWGTPMGVIIAEIQERNPKSPYFSPNPKKTFTAKDFPYTVEQLITIYPEAAKKAKENPEFAKKAQDYVVKLQAKTKGIYDLWKEMRKLSIEYFKKTTSWLNVHLDYWYGESDADASVALLSKQLEAKGILKLSDGCKVIDIEKPFKGNKTPPFIMIKSNGAIKYEATDLATIYNRVKEFKPKKILYVIDKRQEMQMFMVFQAAEQIKLYKADECEFLGFGTINGPDGTPLKTRSGGAASLQSAIDDIYAASLKVIQETKKKISQKEKEKIAYCIALASLKFADLSNYRANDYIFTPDKFTRYEGKTGTYILYTTVRIKSILKKVKVQTTSDIEVKEECEKKLLLKLLDFSNVINEAWNKRAPDVICNYIYDLCVLFNAFYHKCPIVSEPNKKTKNSRINLCKMVLNAVENFAKIVGIFIPEKM